MTRELEQLVAETIELTGTADAPRLLDSDAPIFASPDDSESMYLIGLIGGKDVGKSSLVNALVGREISEPTSYGPGTETVIAYAHESVASELRDTLDREVPERFRIVTHGQPLLRRQVLLDLPDIDSRYTEHVQITRQMLRHMLYPIWIQSIEKYADQQPQRLLAMVAEGNDPANFVFCLNKVDQLIAREDDGAVQQLKDDFATRIARTLAMSDEPQVFAISATRPETGDLPALRQLLSRERSVQTVREAQHLAIRRQDRSLLAWLDRQDLPQRSAALARLQDEAEELAAARIAEPLLEQALPRLVADPGHRLSMLEPAMHKRMSRWPIVNVIDSLLAPLLALIKTNVSVAPASATIPLDTYLNQDGRSVAALTQATFAHLYRSHPAVGALYQNQKLWDDMPADSAAAELRRRLSGTVERQREVVMQRVAGKSGIISPVFRWLLTIGAILWFPFIQPVLHLVLAGGLKATGMEIARLVVELLGVTYLLKNVTFLLIWFVVLWAILRWDTQRRVERQLRRWKSTTAIDDPMSLSGQTLQWIDELIDPIRAQRTRVEALVLRIDRMRDELQLPRDVAA